MLLACQGAGAVVGAIVLSAVGRFRKMGRALLLLQLVLGALAGALADVVGPSLVLTVNGVCLSVIAATMLLLPRTRSFREV